MLHLWQSNNVISSLLYRSIFMNKYAIRESRHRVLAWLFWLIVALASLCGSAPVVASETTVPVQGIVIHDAQKSGPLFPWQARHRWRKWSLYRYRKWRKAKREVKRKAQMAELALSGVMTMAQVVDQLTASQLRYKVGALPVLYALLETLQVGHIINRHCATRGEVAHGTVAVVLILNRLMFPLPLYQVADWVGQTCLVAMLGIPADKFNDDRLGRTLDALYPHLEAIWLEVIELALLKADIDLSLIFYDLTAFIAHGRYADSEPSISALPTTRPEQAQVQTGVECHRRRQYPLAVSLVRVNSGPGYRR